ncbi:hypothetical protein JCM14036_33980 [Desulfotomaculum defluvii]
MFSIKKKKIRNVHIGGIAGYSNGGVIKDCNFNGTIKINGNAKNVGGIVGYAEETIIEDCHSQVNIEIMGDAENVGEVVGCSINSKICYSNSLSNYLLDARRELKTLIFLPINILML